MTETMKAVRIHSYGEPEVMVLEDVPRPVAGAGEALIRVRAAGVNPIDYKVRDGTVPIWRDLGLPATLGFDVSGDIVALGDGVDDRAVGEAVYAMVGFPGIGATYAEYVTAPADHFAPKPTSVDHDMAAGIPLVALTAWQALFDVAGLEAGQSVLVHAAAGGVGHIAIQLAKWKGATVHGTASPRNADFLRGLGLDNIIDYTTSRFEDVVSGVDVVFDTMGGEVRERSWGVLADGGILVTITGRLAPDAAGPGGERVSSHSVRPDADQLARIAALIDDGTVTPVLDTVYPLAEAARAHDQVAGHHVRGKIVLHVAD